MTETVTPLAQQYHDVYARIQKVKRGVTPNELQKAKDGRTDTTPAAIELARLLALKLEITRGLAKGQTAAIEEPGQGEPQDATTAPAPTPDATPIPSDPPADATPQAKRAGRPRKANPDA